MKTEIYWIPGEFPGRIGVMPRPRGGDWLEEEIASLRQAGTEIVVSLLESEEVKQLDLDSEEALCLQNHLELVSFPIPDRGVPESRRETVQLVERLARSVQDGRSIVVHCRQGIGRSSLVAALVLLSLGIPADQVFTVLAEARGCDVPNTEQQIQYVLRFNSVPR